MTRRVSRTALIYCEGAEDLAFVRHLVALYGESRGLKKKFRVRQNGGGSADSIVLGATKSNGAFDLRLVVLDSDRADVNPVEREAAEVTARQHSIGLIWNTPCLESMLLGVLENNDHSNTANGKSVFERKYMKPEDRTDSRSYSAILTLEQYENARARIPSLDLLIRFITD